jgi:hypothetical protein
MEKPQTTVMCPKCNHYSVRIPENFAHTVYCNLCFCELESSARD